MSTTCHSISTHRPFATAFFGGVDRGKIVQLHMKPEDLNDLTLSLLVEDELDIVEPFGDWLRGQCVNARMILFDCGLADPKAGRTVSIQN